MIDLITGFTGMGLILIAFILNQLNKWSSESIAYDVVNSVGSGLLVAYSLMIGSWPFLILNGIWMTVSIRDVFLDWKKIEKQNAHIGYKKKKA